MLSLIMVNLIQQRRTHVWYTGTEARTTWIDAIVYPKPYATKFNSSGTGTFPSIVGETGVGQSVHSLNMKQGPIKPIPMQL